MKLYLIKEPNHLIDGAKVEEVDWTDDAPSGVFITLPDGQYLLIELGFLEFYSRVLEVSKPGTKIVGN